MNTPKSLKTNFKWMFVSNITFTFFQWMILVVIAKFGDQQSVGIYTLGLAITAPIMTFANLQLRAIQVTDAKSQNSFQDFFTLRFLFMIFGLLFTLLIICLSDYPQAVNLIIFFIAISKAIEGMSDIVYGFFQKNENMSVIAVSLVLRGALSLIAFLLAYSFSQNLLTATIFSSIAWLLVFLIYDLKKIRNYKIEMKSLIVFQKKVLYSLFLISLPMGLVTMLGSLNSNIPRYLIEHYISIEALGIFGAILYIMTGASKFTTAITQTVSPRLAKYYANNQKKEFLSLFYKVLWINILLGFAGLFAALLFGKQILTVIYSKEYADYYVFFQLVMLFSLISYISNVIGVAVTSMRLFSSQLSIQVIKLILILISSFFFIKLYGLNGAIWALIVSTIISSIFYIKLFLNGIKKIGGY